MSEVIAGTPPHNGVIVAGGGELQCSPANRHVFLTTCQGLERNATKSRVSAINTSVGAIETCQRGVTDSDVSSLVVFSLSASAPMAVLKPAVVLFLIAAAPIPVRCLPVVFMKRHSKTNGQVEVGVVLAERLRPNGHVKAASGVVRKRPRTNRHIIRAVSIVQ